MTQQEFLQHLASLNGNDKDTFISQFGKKQSDILEWINEYDPEKHDVMNPALRRNKSVRKPSGQKDQFENDILVNDTVYVTRIAVDIQQEVTKSASGILCTNKIQLVGKVNPQPIQDVWDNNKLDLRTISICNYWLSETEVAELWYKIDGEDKVMILANSLGDKLYPIFDDKGKMICFIRKYCAKTLVAGIVDLRDVNYYEIYTEKDVVKGNDQNNGIFSFDNPVPHGYEKIPIIYACREKPVWNNAQTSIERWEESISNLCDTNDYFGSPTGVVKGKIISYADKGESGKLIQIDADASIEYLTWNQAPESIKLEWETLRSIVYNSTRTINLSIDNLKGLFGSAPSSYAIKLLFTPAHMQAAENEEVFGEYIQRRINLIGSFTGVESGAVQPKFTYYLPKNDTEELTNIINAKNAGILSDESAVIDSPLTIDSNIELERIKSESESSPIPDNTGLTAA